MRQNVILRPAPDGSQDEAAEIDLPDGINVGHAFEHDGKSWTIAGELNPQDTELRFRGTSAWLAVPRS